MSGMDQLTGQLSLEEYTSVIDLMSLGSFDTQTSVNFSRRLLNKKFPLPEIVKMLECHPDRHQGFNELMSDTDVTDDEIIEFTRISNATQVISKNVDKRRRRKGKKKRKKR